MWGKPIASAYQPNQPSTPPSRFSPTFTHEYKSYPAALALPLVGSRALSLSLWTRKALAGGAAAAAAAGAAMISCVTFLLVGASEESAEGGGGDERLESVDMRWGVDGGVGHASFGWPGFRPWEDASRRARFNFARVGASRGSPASGNARDANLIAGTTRPYNSKQSQLRHEQQTRRTDSPTHLSVYLTNNSPPSPRPPAAAPPSYASPSPSPTSQTSPASCPGSAGSRR